MRIAEVDDAGISIGFGDWLWDWSWDWSWNIMGAFLWDFWYFIIEASINLYIREVINNTG